MAVLKFRNENGEWIYAPSLKYKDGVGVWKNAPCLKYKDEQGVWHRVHICGSKSNDGDYPTISTLTVGSSVYLNENGNPVEYLIVHAGIPNSTLYDSSCDGVWLLRKNICGNYAWSGTNNDYGKSSAKVYVDEVFINQFDAGTKEIIKQVKIPYVNGTGSNGAVASGTNGLSVKVFLLSGYEVGWTTAKSKNFPIDGACLDYFNNITDDKRIAYLNGTASVWWLRSPDISGTTGVFAVHSNGNNTVGSYKGTYGIRPALILPYTTKFDPKTNTIIG